ncbi:DUF58 domain-containing protein [Marinicella gelatinilytica]|uniref:DUF58 domain-containing protein n=1 Tax=Marinicella gelatinilytica TaxID=2996017 RepID=UPI002260C61B|nr:DUF58 domain-containing protein [Marinicella gelatinilytica]MCX7545050.1 DUF58 domain-containing protein [Marinicella gelatinilytica]
MFDRIKQYFINRRGPEVLPVTLHWRRLYVLPSKPGMFFFLIGSTMMLAGLNFNNNMSLMLVFLLFGMAQVILYKTFFNLKSVVVEQVHAKSVFLGECYQIRLQLAAASDRYQIQVDMEDSTDITNITAQTGQWQLEGQSRHRGYQSIPRLKLLTRYPLGLVTVWAYCQPQAQVLIYPRPEQPCPPFPIHGGIDGPDSTVIQGDEMDDLKQYQSGDPIRDIAWKKSAQGQGIFVKKYHLKQGKELLFDFQQLAQVDVEARLSRLTAWVVAAEKQHTNYQLKLPNFTSAMSHGERHYHDCLSALALFGQGGAS